MSVPSVMPTDLWKFTQTVRAGVLRGTSPR